MATNLGAFKHVLRILEIENDVETFLATQRVKSIRKLVHTSENSYKGMINENGLPLTAADVDQIRIFKAWHADFINKQGVSFNEQELRCQLH